MEDKQAYVEDYNSVLSEVVPLPRRTATAKRQSGLSQCMNMSYEGVQSDSGYSSHSADQAKQGKESEEESNTPTEQTPPPVPAHHRRQISQLNSVMNSSPQMPTPTNSRPGSSKNLSRSNSPAIREDRDRRPPPPPQRPESPTESDDESDCDCANCRGMDQKTPSSPLSAPWNMNYPPFNNGPHPGPPGPPGPMLSGSFPKNYGQPGFPPMVPPYGRYETTPPYGRPQQLLPPISLDEEAIEEEHDLPPRRPDSTRRDKPRPMSYSGTSSQNPVSSHGSWGAYGGGYPAAGGPPPPGSQPPPSGYPPSQYQNPALNGASGSPQNQSALTYGYPPPGPGPYPGYPPPPQGYPPYNGAEMVPWPYNAPNPSSEYGGSMAPPPPGSMPPPPSHLPLNRRYSMRAGELPPPRDYASMDSPQQGGMPPMPNGPPGPMNRRSSQRGQQPAYMHQDFHQRSISVPPGAYGETGAPVQDSRRRVTTPQPLLSSRTRRDSNTSASAASSRLPPMQTSRYVDTGNTPPHTYTDNSPGTEPPYRASPHPPSHPPQPQTTPHHQNPNRYSGHFPRLRSPSISSQNDPNYGALVPRHPGGLVSLYNDNESAITTDYDIPEESEDAEHYAVVPIPHDTHGGNVRMYYSSGAPIRLQIHGQPGPAQRIQLSGVPHLRDHSIELTVTYRYVSNSERLRIEEGLEDEDEDRKGLPRMIEDSRGRRSVDPGHREYVLGEE